MFALALSIRYSVLDCRVGLSLGAVCRKAGQHRAPPYELEAAQRPRLLNAERHRILVRLQVRQFKLFHPRYAAF